MLILDASGHICSHAGLGAAAFLVGAGGSRQMPGPPCGKRRYDPLRGARLHGAPEGCHRWIIADIDFDPWAANKPHFYYDMTDEGREALGAARAAGAQWPRAVEDAASKLKGMPLPDLLETACRSSGPLRDLGKIRGDLAGLCCAWKIQDKGMPASPASAEDQVLVDLESNARWNDGDYGTGTVLDYLLCFMSVVKSVHKMACEAEPTTRDEAAVLRALTGAIQDLCRRHGRDMAADAAASPAGHGAASGRSGPAGRDDEMPQRQTYTHVTPALICDLYYCLAEYCRSRRLAVDPLSLPLSEQLTEEEKAHVIEVLEADSLDRRAAD